MIMPMTGIRIAWLALAIAVGVLGSASAQWPVYEITSCEIGFDSLSSAVCLGTVHEYFGRQLFLVLAIPVALCIVPAVIPRPVVSWLVAGAMLSTAVWGFAVAFSSTTPSLVAMVGSVPAAVLALVLAATHQVIAVRDRATARTMLRARR